jgi:hypothetical protein
MLIPPCARAFDQNPKEIRDVRRAVKRRSDVMRFQINNRRRIMPSFIIERNVPGADKLSADELRDISTKSNEVVAGLGVPYTWITSYVAGDKLYCVHEAENAEVVRRHAREGGFPANKVTEIAAVIGPKTANARPSAITPYE